MTIKIGFVGTSLSHPLSIGRVVQRYGLGEIAGVWGEEDDTAEKISHTLNIPRLETPEAVLELCDVAVIATRTDQHSEYAMRAIDAGRPVFVDKPLALSLADADTILDYAQDKGVPLMSCSIRRYAPAFVSLAEEVRSGQAGLPISATRFEPHGIQPGGWQDRPETSGGLIFSFGIHCVDNLRALMGCEPVAVSCFASKLQHQDAHSHDAATITIQFANGAVGHAEVIGAMTPGPHMATAPAMRAFCTEQSMEARLVEDQAQRYNGGRLGVSPYYDIASGLLDMARAIIEMARTGESPIATSEMREVISILEAARISTQTRQTVSLSKSESLSST